MAARLSKCFKSLFSFFASRRLFYEHPNNYIHIGREKFKGVSNKRDTFSTKSTNGAGDRGMVNGRLAISVQYRKITLLK